MANRITAITNGMDGTQSETLGYNAMNRLASVSSTADNESYSYDADGNRLNAMINEVGWMYAPSGTSNRLVSLSSDGSTINFKYDPEGDTFGYSTGTPTQMFYYNVFDRLNGTYVNGLSTHYEVDAEGQRLYKYTADTDTYFVPGAGGALAADVDGVWRDFVYLNGRLVTVVANGGVYPVASDQTGRPLALTDGTQAVVWCTQPLPFGGGTVTQNDFGNFNLGFPGQYFDQEDSLWYNGHRDYDAALGRYIESDPIGLAGGVNTYVYTGDDPINSVDPLGLCDQNKCKDASAVVAALGRQFSSDGAFTSWSGIGLVGLSVVAAALAPEGLEVEVPAGEYGAALVDTGGYLSAIGAGLQGYARDGVTGALRDGGETAIIGFANKLGARWLSRGARKAYTVGMAGLMDKTADALRQEAAACTGN